MRSLMVVCVMCGIAVADNAKPKLSAADQKKYKALLDKGRKLEDAKKYDEAFAAFNEALAVASDDPTVLAEMGWTAYLKKDYDSAETYTRRALANQSTPNIRGAAFYNLGLAQEKKGDRAGAIKSYIESLKARWNTTVRAALSKLDPAALAEFDAFNPSPLAGPFKSIEAFCKTRPTRKPAPLEGYGDQKCTCSRDDKAKHADPAKPFEGFDWVKENCNVNGTDVGELSYLYAVKVAGSWYVGDIAGSYTNRWCSGEGIETQEVRIDQGRAVLRVVEVGGCNYPQSDTSFTREQLVAVGIGPSGKPSGTPVFSAARHEEEAHHDIDLSSNPQPAKVTVDSKLDVTWTKDGVVIKGGKDADARLVGTHKLSFP
jgi:hypothetical protein